MLPDIENIKSKRIKLGLKQKELALESGVSQSLITKLESKRLEPSYLVVKKIFSALERLEHKSEKVCQDIMSSPIIFIRKNDSIEKAINLMKSKSVSQLPVIDNKRVIGSFSESIILDNLLAGKSKQELMKIKVEEIMREPFPIVRKDMPVSTIISLLKATESILVSDKSELVGIITKASLI